MQFKYLTSISKILLIIIINITILIISADLYYLYKLLLLIVAIKISIFYYKQQHYYNLKNIIIDDYQYNKQPPVWITINNDYSRDLRKIISIKTIGATLTAVYFQYPIKNNKIFIINHQLLPIKSFKRVRKLS